MTRKEAICELKMHISPYDTCKADRDANEAIWMAIEALKQEPCEDAISREAIFEMIKDHSYPVRYDTNSIEQGMTLTGITQVLSELSAVTPIRPKGRWIKDRCDMYQCSECSHTYTDLSCGDNMANYCPICGADMWGRDE